MRDPLDGGRVEFKECADRTEAEELLYALHASAPDLPVYLVEGQILRDAAAAERPGYATPQRAPGPRPFTLTEYLRMKEVGIVRPDERLEFYDGVVCRMAEESPEHDAAVARVRTALAGLAQPEQAVLWTGPLVLRAPRVSLLRRLLGIWRR